MLLHSPPRLEELAYHVMINFAKQKNGHKMEKRSQRRMNHSNLCSVKSWVRVVKQIRVKDLDPSINTSVYYKEDGKVMEAMAEMVVMRLRVACQFAGAGGKLGINPEDLVIKSIRSGAAMVLFLSKNLPERIKILIIVFHTIV